MLNTYSFTAFIICYLLFFCVWQKNILAFALYTGKYICWWNIYDLGCDYIKIFHLFGTRTISLYTKIYNLCGLLTGLYFFIYFVDGGILLITPEIGIYAICLLIYESIVISISNISQIKLSNKVYTHIYIYIYIYVTASIKNI